MKQDKKLSLGYSYKIPDASPSFEDISKQLRINADIIMKEFTDHIDKEIVRFRNEAEKIYDEMDKS